MSAQETSGGVIPSPEALVEKSLNKAPDWIRKSILNGLAVAGWIGLISTVVSTLSGLRWVIDLAVSLYRQAGVLQPILGAIGAGIHWFAEMWRGFTHPIWQFMFGWLDVALPAWAPDIFTLLVLIGMGSLRRYLRVLWGERMSMGLLWRPGDPLHEGDDDYVALPRKFPYAQYLADRGIRWNAKRLAGTQRLWRKWRKMQIWRGLWRDSSRWPRYRNRVVRAQFTRYWVAVMDGRIDLRRYLVAVAIIAVALVVDSVI